MSLEQKRYLLNVIRGYQFAFKATKNIGYKIVSDRLLKQLRNEVYNDNVVQLKAA